MQGLFLLLEVLMTARFMRTVAPLVAASAACGLMVGCGGGSPEATSSPPSSTTTSAASPTTSKTTSTSATPTSPTSNATYAGAPGVPEAAKHKTDAGAIAFARHYTDQINVVSQRPAAGVLEPLAQATCKTCRAQQKSIGKLISAKQRYTGALASFVRGARLPDPSGVVIGLRMKRHSTTVIDSSGATVNSTQVAGERGLIFRLTWSSAGWRVVEIHQDDADVTATMP